MKDLKSRPGIRKASCSLELVSGEEVSWGEQESECVTGICDIFGVGGEVQTMVQMRDFYCIPQCNANVKEAGTLTFSPMPICIPSVYHTVQVNIDL